MASADIGPTRAETAREGKKSMPRELPHAACGRAFGQLDIVVIDDAKTMQTIVRSMLHSFRVGRVRTFDGAAAAMQSMIVEPPHLVIVDWHMAPVDGISLIQAMRAERMGALALVPALLITAHPTRKLVEASIRASAHSLLAKPFAPATLLKRIEAIVSDRRPFVLDIEAHEWMLKGTIETLETQRARWRKYHSARTGYTELIAPIAARAAKPQDGPDKPAADAGKPGAAKVEVVAELSSKKSKGLGGRRGDQRAPVDVKAKTGHGGGKAA
ncbi:MAG: response regulator [Ancalomicrobiaceae bacterium]|nr:response regulator [Ancalomicrobiaceae bacterium]